MPFSFSALGCDVIKNSKKPAAVEAPQPGVVPAADPAADPALDPVIDPAADLDGDEAADPDDMEADPSPEALSFEADLGWALNQLGLDRDEILSHQIYEDKVVVVTIDGQKRVAQ